MIIVLMSEIDGVFVFVGFFHAAGKAGQIVCPFVEISIVQIVLFLKDVLFYALETVNRQDGARQRSHGWHSDCQIDLQNPTDLDSRLPCITTHDIDVRWLRIGQCELCILCGPGLRKWDWKIVGFKLFALGFEKLCESQAFNKADGDTGHAAYRLCFAVRYPLYNMFESAKRTVQLDHAPFVIRLHLCKELIHFQLEHI